MRFIGSHQIIKNSGLANSLECNNSLERDNSPKWASSNELNDKTGLLAGLKSKITFEDVHALLLFFTAMTFLFIGLFIAP
ncbi:hypothetical protein [Shewanella violacea]|nr:hypothetical protein [Shewanella violacea]